LISLLLIIALRDEISQNQISGFAAQMENKLSDTRFWLSLQHVAAKSLNISRLLYSPVFRASHLPPSLELLPKRKSVTGMNTSAKLSELNARADCIIYPAIKMQRSFSKQCAFLFARAPRLHFAFAHNTRDKKLIPFQRQKPLGNLLHTDRFGSHRAKPFFALAGKGVYIFKCAAMHAKKCAELGAAAAEWFQPWTIE
jgi:hypothetical protein